jgi:TPR repeat protein
MTLAKRQRRKALAMTRSPPTSEVRARRPSIAKSVAFFLVGVVAFHGSEVTADDIGRGAELAASGDREAAIRLLQPLAEHGNGKAAWVLGDVYARGVGAAKDVARAIRWYRLAIAYGDLEGYNRIAGLYQNGDGVPKDLQAAIRWYSAAAKRDSSNAKFNLGLIYSDDRSDVTDYVKAYAWLTIADMHEIDAPSGWTPGAFRDRLKAKMTEAQVTEAQQRVQRWIAHREAP